MKRPCVFLGVPALALLSLSQTLPSTVGQLQASGYYWKTGNSYYAGPMNFLCTLPVAGSFSWVNQGGASETASGNALVLHAPANNGVQIRARVQNIGANTTATGYLVLNQVEQNFVTTGLLFYESGTGKIETVDIGPFNGATAVTGKGVNQYNSASSFNTFLYGTDSYTQHIVIYRLIKSGGNITFQSSLDGVNFVTLFSQAQNAFFTTAPDQWGYFVDTENASYDAYGVLLSWKVQ